MDEIDCTIKASGKNNPESFKSLVRASLYKTKNAPPKNEYIKFSVLCAVIVSVAALFPVFDVSVTPTAVIITLSLFSFSVISYTYFFAYRNNYRNSGVAKDAYIKYSFGALTIEIESHSDTLDEKATLSYDGISSVIENENYYFMFVKSNTAYIIEKSGFESEEDSARLRSRFILKNIKLIRQF